MSVEGAEAALQWGANWVRIGLEAVAAALVACGGLVGVTRLLIRLPQSRGSPFVSDRLAFARYLAWALEFQLASDILSTTLSPTWSEIGELAAVAAIRIGLNISLARDTAEDRRHTTAPGIGSPSSAPLASTESGP